MGIEILGDDLLERFRLITAVELTSLPRSLLVLETAQEVSHEFMRVVLQYRVELLDHNILKVVDVDNILVPLEHGLVEEVEAIAEIEIVSLCPSILIVSILLQQIVVSHLCNGGKALHESIQIAIIAVVSHAKNAFFKVI